MKIFLSLVIFSLVFQGSVAESKVKILKTTKRTPAGDTDAYLAGMNFVGFLNCSKNGLDEQKKAEDCVKGFMSQTLNAGNRLRYMEAFSIASEFSEPYYCDEEMNDRIKRLEKSRYDLYLCFNSNLRGEPSAGVVFFVNERGMPRIVKIKM